MAKKRKSSILSTEPRARIILEQLEAMLKKEKPKAFGNTTTATDPERFQKSEAEGAKELKALRKKAAERARKIKAKQKKARE